MEPQSRDCRNAVTCFKCRGVGHRSFDCRTRKDSWTPQQNQDLSSSKGCITEDPTPKGVWGRGGEGRESRQGVEKVKTCNIREVVKVTVPALPSGDIHLLQTVVAVEVLEEDKGPVSAKEIRAFMSRTWGVWPGKIVCSLGGRFMVECPSMAWREAVMKWGVVDDGGVKLKFAAWEEEDEEAIRADGEKVILYLKDVPLCCRRWEGMFQGVSMVGNLLGWREGVGLERYARTVEVEVWVREGAMIPEGWWWIVPGKKVWVQCEIVKQHGKSKSGVKETLIGIELRPPSSEKPGAPAGLGREDAGKSRHVTSGKEKQQLIGVNHKARNRKRAGKRWVERVVVKATDGMERGFPSEETGKEACRSKRGTALHDVHNGGYVEDVLETSHQNPSKLSMQTDGDPKSSNEGAASSNMASKKGEVTRSRNPQTAVQDAQALMENTQAGTLEERNPGTREVGDSTMVEVTTDRLTWPEEKVMALCMDSGIMLDKEKVGTVSLVELLQRME
ncbi:hypothetical protein J5N97_022884 [Dioscorea zingiberensis]|uniref:CCHC-type domain-containing protein n=1 Tax=Dioscorea zingiberensis TaxID=325984 RepID=A0A9D5HB92_9LILI|nr:hypothetical protein J5N97_022884 [Dioscorea zingiberensis]